jgi:inhibitor of KinA
MNKTGDIAISWRYVPMGEAALLVKGTPDLPLTNRYVLALARTLDALALPGVSPAVPAINSLLLVFDPLALDYVELCEQVHALLDDLEPAPAIPARVIDVPVTYGGAAGPDLDKVATALGLAPAELVAIHTAEVYRVMMIGFTPGFPYIGPLPDRLQVPRLTTPRAAVPAGSVAIAAGLTGIYPARLPGGWHLIGRTDLLLFDPAATPPATLEPGDGVRFVPLPTGVLP